MARQKQNPMTQNNAKNTNYVGAEYKYEVAEELGVNLGGDATARENGKVGGQMTKKLVSKAKTNSNAQSMKYETAKELGVEIGPDATARENGKVGGSMTKKLVNKAKNKK